MQILVMVLVITGALTVIASGVWVAAALISAISSRHITASTQNKTNENNTNRNT